MNSLQESSLRIRKKARHSKAGDRSYICGGCQRSYKSYPALYLHIKRKHNGIRPPNTKASKPVGPVISEKTHTGRPQKVSSTFLVYFTIFSPIMMLMTSPKTISTWKTSRVSSSDISEKSSMLFVRWTRSPSLKMLSLGCSEHQKS